MCSVALGHMLCITLCELNWVVLPEVHCIEWHELLSVAFTQEQESRVTVVTMWHFTQWRSKMWYCTDIGARLVWFKPKGKRAPVRANKADNLRRCLGHLWKAETERESFERQINPNPGRDPYNSAPHEISEPINCPTYSQPYRALPTCKNKHYKARLLKFTFEEGIRSAQNSVTDVTYQPCMPLKCTSGQNTRIINKSKEVVQNIVLIRWIGRLRDGNE